MCTVDLGRKITRKIANRRTRASKRIEIRRVRTAFTNDVLKTVDTRSKHKDKILDFHCGSRPQDCGKQYKTQNVGFPDVVLGICGDSLAEETSIDVDIATSFHTVEVIRLVKLAFKLVRSSRLCGV